MLPTHLECRMTARKLAQQFPIVTPDTDAMDAAQTMARLRWPGLIVSGDDGRPYTILPGSEVLRFLIPTYVQDDPGLARALDERASDELFRKLVRSTVRDLLPQPPDYDDLPVVDADATSLEVAAVMARMRSPLVAVVDGDKVVGAITVNRPSNTCCHQHLQADDLGTCRRGVRRRLCPDCHRTHPQGRSRPGRRRGNGAPGRGRRAGRVLQREDRRRLERHLPTTGHDGNRQCPEADRSVRLRGHMGRQTNPRPPVRHHGHARGCLLYTSPSPRDGLLSRMPS